MKRGGKCIRELLLCGLLIVPSASAVAQANPATSSSRPARDGQHDFDFEFGAWKCHISRLQHPLTGSTTWLQYEGTSIVRKVWNGRANMGELEVDGPAGHIEGLTLRLYNPQSRQWYISWATATMAP